MIKPHTESRELAPARLERILDHLRRRRFARVNDLCSELSASPATVRRDLGSLDRDGKLRRLHGGAMLAEGHLHEPAFDDKTAVSAAEKERIARAALRFVNSTDTVFLDGGSTILAMAGLLAGHPGVTVVTNSLRVASALAAGGPRLILVGGELRRHSQTFVGPLTRHLLEQLRVDKAFMGTIGVSRAELSTTDPREAFTKELVMQRASQVILLADHTKMDAVSFVRFGSCDEIDVLITDRRAPRKNVQDMRRRGIQVLTV
jgi:DeoR/GlpR family transcriptional regulator of sugar metabolism